MLPHDTIALTRKESGISTVTLFGDHDLLSAEAIHLKIVSALFEGDVIVDLSPCTFMDSSVIHALSRSLRAARAAGRRVVLAVPANSSIRRVIDIAGLDHAWMIVSCVTEADAMLELRPYKPAKTDSHHPASHSARMGAA